MLAVLVFFSIPIGRFYLRAPLNPVECLEAGHSHSASSPHDHESDMHFHSPADGSKSGFFFQHCKDTYDGLALSPAQPLGVPVTISLARPVTFEVVAIAEQWRRPDSFAFPPFHPPRHLG